MTDTTSPSGTVDNGPLTFSEGVEAIENLLPSAPEMDLAPADEDKTNGTPEEAPADDEEHIVLEDDETVDSSEEEAKAPATISDDHMVTLQDGQTISLGELKRNNLFQRDYSQKTEALRREEERLRFDYEQRVSQAEAEIRQKRDFVLQIYSQVAPQAPPRPNVSVEEDPFAWMTYTEQKERYEAHMGEINRLYHEAQAEQQAVEAQKQQQFQANLEQEREKMLAKLPKLKDEKKFEEFRSDVGEIATSAYGFSPEELVTGLTDHRMVQVLHDAIQYRKALKRASAAKQEVGTKPRLETKQRMAPQSVQVRDRQGRFEALRQQGSIDNAARLIETLI